VLFSVSGPAAERSVVEVGWHPIDADDPIDALLGFVAPAGWHAIGIVSTGRARPLDDDGLPRSVLRPSRRAPRAPEPARVVLAIARSGMSLSRVRVGARVFDTTEAVQGRVADGLRRAFGLPTAPPPGTSAELWTTVWLDRIVEAAVAADPARLRSWSEVAALHPAAGAASPFAPPPSTAAPPPAATPSPTAAPSPADPRPPDDPAGPPDPPAVPSAGPDGGPAGTTCGIDRFGPSQPPRATPDPAGDAARREPAALAADAVALADMWPWNRLRVERHQLDVGPSPVASHIAAWMDDGMFARWLLGAFPPLPDLLATCDDLLPRPIVDRLLATVTATLDAMPPIP